MTRVPRPGSEDISRSTAAGADQTVGDGEAKARAHGLAGSQRLEELSQPATLHALTLVRDLDLGGILKIADREIEAPARGHGLEAIASQIPQDLHQFILGDGDPERP